MFALISENKVVEIVKNKFDVAEPLYWVECTQEVKYGWFLKDGVFLETLKSKDEQIVDAKIEKINEIGNAKEEALYAPIAYLNTSFSASERACQNMLGNLVLNGETVEWQDLNKKPIIMTRAQFQTLAVMVKNQRNASYFKEGELMKKIALAKTPEELNLIKW